MYIFLRSEASNNNNAKKIDTRDLRTNRELFELPTTRKCDIDFQ